MLVAAFAAGFTSCDNKGSNDDENTTHAQVFTLGQQSYHVDNAITIENIQYQGSDEFDAIVLSQGELIGESGGDGQGIVILFKNTNGIPAGSFSLSSEDDYYPKYAFAHLTVDDIVNFDWDNLMTQSDAYLGFNGLLTIEFNDEKFVITTDGIEVNKYDVDENGNPVVVETTTSSVDCEKTMSRYILATVQEGMLTYDDGSAPIVTAGRMAYELPAIFGGKQNLTCFISEEGDMISFVYSGDVVPTGTNDHPILMFLEGMDIENPYILSTGVLDVEALENGYYLVNIHDANINGKTYTLHYQGTLPYFDFPF